MRLFNHSQINSYMLSNFNHRELPVWNEKGPLQQEQGKQEDFSPHWSSASSCLRNGHPAPLGKGQDLNCAAFPGVFPSCLHQVKIQFQERAHNPSGCLTPALGRKSSGLNRKKKPLKTPSSVGKRFSEAFACSCQRCCSTSTKGVGWNCSLFLQLQLLPESVERSPPGFHPRRSTQIIFLM